MKFDKLSKRELLAEIVKRNANGADIREGETAKREDLVFALELDDEARKADPAMSDPVVVDQKEHATSDGVQHREIPHDLELYKGSYIFQPEGEAHGEAFGLRVLPADEVRHGRTHHCKNALHFWDGTATEFKAQFERP